MEPDPTQWVFFIDGDEVARVESLAAGRQILGHKLLDHRGDEGRE